MTEEQLVRRFERLRDRYGATPSVFHAFRNIIYTSFRKNPRNFPWRSTRNPYRIIVSELMLQQTQTTRVVGKYQNFILRFPDFKALANASVRDVLKAWQGLGYNRRALMLKRLAERVVRDCAGVLSSDEKELRKLPGVGGATAAAVAAFAFGKPSVLIETNIRRVFIHFFFHDRNGVRDSEIRPLVEQALDYSNPRAWYYALMDYGVKLARQGQNPHRRSAHYTKQRAFEGSSRQVRGKLLRELLDGKAGNEKELSKMLIVPSSQLSQILLALRAEGFIKKEERKWLIA